VRRFTYGSMRVTYLADFTKTNNTQAAKYAEKNIKQLQCIKV
jgi:hypothetical protein